MKNQSSKKKTAQNCCSNHHGNQRPVAIVKEQAEAIQRIFEDFRSGLSCAEIAANLNRKAAIYARCAAQDEKSLEKQIAEALALAASLGIASPEVISEFGPGTQIKPGLKKLLERVDAGDIGYIIAVHPDCLGRDARLLTQMAERMSASGASFIWQTDTGVKL